MYLNLVVLDDYFFTICMYVVVFSTSFFIQSMYVYICIVDERWNLHRFSVFLVFYTYGKKLHRKMLHRKKLTMY